MANIYYGDTVKLRETPVRNLVPPWNRKVFSGTTGKFVDMVKTQIIGTIRSQALRDLNPMGAVQRLNVGGRNTEGVLHKIESVRSEMRVLKRNKIRLPLAVAGELQEVRKYRVKRLPTPTKHYKRLFGYNTKNIKSETFLFFHNIRIIRIL